MKRMKRTIIMRKIMIGFSAALTAIILVTFVAAQGGGSGNVRTSIGPVRDLINPAIIPYSGASLERNNDGMFWKISTSRLTPGFVASLWLAIYNNESECAAATCAPPDLNNPLVNGSLQNGGGVVVGPDGRADFAGFLALGDNTGFFLNPMFPNMPNPAPGLVNTKGAEVHLAIRTHGPASTDPAVLQQQLTQFNGGCNPTCATVQFAPFQP